MIEKLLRAENKQPPQQQPVQVQQIHMPMNQIPVSPQQYQYYDYQQFQRQANVIPFPEDKSLQFQLSHQMKQTFPETILSEANCHSPNNGSLNLYSPSSSLTLANCTAEELEFESAFRKFFKVYTKLNEEDKPIKIRKIVRSSSQREAEKISEFLDLFQTEGFHKSPESVAQKNSPCQCPTCPFQTEISQLNEYYDQILSFPPIQQFE